MIDVSIRLRRAIHASDLALVKRILKNNGAAIRNADLADRANTSLHLAARLGCTAILAWLIEAGHEHDGISLNTDFETPLMTACEAKQVETGQLLIAMFPHCIGWTNRHGMDALMLSARNGTLPLLSLLLTSTPAASTAAQDKDGNTALHYASASGELKALRLLLQYGASPHAQNSYSWTPIAYSATTAAEIYFKQLVAEMERRRVEAAKFDREQQQQLLLRPGTSGSAVSGGGSGGAAAAVTGAGGSSIRLVSNSSSASDDAQAGQITSAAAAAAQQARATMRTPTMDGRAGSAAGFRGRLESFGERNLERGSPLVVSTSSAASAGGAGAGYHKTPMTPTDPRAGFDFNVGMSRRRAESNE